MVAPLTTAGVSGGVAQELQMPLGPQMLEDVEEPMPARPAPLRDPGTPDQIVMRQHNLTHVPRQHWYKMCVESRGHDLPHREPSKIDAVVPQLQFDYVYLGDGGPLQIACFLLGTDTSSGAIHATIVPDSKKVDMPLRCRNSSQVDARPGVSFVHMETKKKFYNCYWTKWQKNVVLKDKTGRFFDKCHRHRAIRVMEQTEIQKRDSSTGRTSPHSPSWSKCQSPYAAMGSRHLAAGRDTLGDEHLLGTAAGVLRSTAVLSRTSKMGAGSSECHAPHTVVSTPESSRPTSSTENNV